MVWLMNMLKEMLGNIQIVSHITYLNTAHGSSSLFLKRSNMI